MNSIRVALVDRPALARRALQSLLEAEEDIEVVWSAASLKEAANRYPSAPPDLLLLDCTDPNPSFSAQVQRFLAACPHSQWVALTDHGEGACSLFADKPSDWSLCPRGSCCIQQAFMLGARGAVRKTGTPEELLRVLRTVHGGRIAVEEPSLSLLLGRLFGQPPPKPPQLHLTHREVEVVKALGLGKSNKQIGLSLGLSEQTVKNHISRILEKFHLQGRLQIVLFAARHHLITLTDSRQ